LLTNKFFSIIVTLVLMTTLFSATEALEISVNVDPATIQPGESATITVTCDSSGNGKITVKPPGDGGPAKSVDISFPDGGGSVSKVYPGDFPDAGTSTLGEYEVHVVVHDRSAAKSFWVSWEVIPVSPVGSIGLLLTLFAAFGIYAFTKRRPVSLG